MEKTSTSPETTSRYLLLLVCAGLLCATSPLLPGAVPRMAADAGFAPYVAGMLAGALGAAVVLCARSTGLQRAEAARPGALAWVSSGAAAVGVAGWGMASGHGVLLAMLGLGGLAGAGYTGVLMALGRGIATPSLNRNMVAVGLVASAGAVGAWALGLCAPWLQTAAALAALALFVLMERGGVREPVFGDEVPRRALQSLGSVASVPLLGLLAYAFFTKSGAGHGLVRPSIFGADEELLLLLLAGAILAVTGACRQRQPLLSTINQVVAPVMIVVLMVVQSLPGQDASQSFASVLAVFITAFAAVFAAAVVLSLIGSGELPAVWAVGAAVVVYAVGRLTGLGFDVAIDGLGNANFLYRAIMTALLCAMLLVVVFSMRGRLLVRVETPTVSSLGDAVQAASASLARDFSLTAREAQVLEQLLLGRSSTVIASELVISDNTVRAHMKRIYGKLGVSSREELFERAMGRSVG